MTIISKSFNGDLTYSVRSISATRDYVDIGISASSQKWDDFDIEVLYRKSTKEPWLNDASLSKTSAKYVIGNRVYGLDLSNSYNQHVVRWNYKENNLQYGRRPEIKVKVLPRVRTYARTSDKYSISTCYGDGLVDFSGISDNMCIGINQDSKFICLTSNSIRILNNLDDSIPYLEYIGLSNPQYAVQIGNENYLIADYGNDRIIELDKRLSFVREKVVPAPIYIDFSEETETLLITSYSLERVYEYTWSDADLGTQTWYFAIGLSRPMCATYKKGDVSYVAVADTGNNRVVLCNRNNNTTKDIESASAAGSVDQNSEASLLKEPFRVYWFEDGSICVSEKTGKSLNEEIIKSSSSSSSSSIDSSSSSSQSSLSSSSPSSSSLVGCCDKYVAYGFTENPLSNGTYQYMGYLYGYPYYKNENDRYIVASVLILADDPVSGTITDFTINYPDCPEDGIWTNNISLPNQDGTILCYQDFTQTSSSSSSLEYSSSSSQSPNSTSSSSSSSKDSSSSSSSLGGCCEAYHAFGFTSFPEVNGIYEFAGYFSGKPYYFNDAESLYLFYEESFPGFSLWWIGPDLDWNNFLDVGQPANVANCPEDAYWTYNDPTARVVCEGVYSESTSSESSSSSSSSLVGCCDGYHAFGFDNPDRDGIYTFGGWYGSKPYYVNGSATRYLLSPGFLGGYWFICPTLDWNTYLENTIDGGDECPEDGVWTNNGKLICEGAYSESTSSESTSTSSSSTTSTSSFEGYCGNYIASRFSTIPAMNGNYAFSGYYNSRPYFVNGSYNLFYAGDRWRIGVGFSILFSMLGIKSKPVGSWEDGGLTVCND